LVSNDEFRQMLLKGGDDFRSHILWQIRQGFQGEQKNHKHDRLAWALEFLQDVWPHQRSVKNPTMSARLCELLISDSEAFQDLVDVILRSDQITRDIGLHFYLDRENNGIIEGFPSLCWLSYMPFCPITFPIGHTALRRH